MKTMTEGINALRKFSTCEIADAMIRLGFEPWGGYLSDIELWSPTYCEGETRIVGPAYTVKMVKKTDTISPIPKDHFVDSAYKGSVIVISAPSDVKNAVWGGLMSTRAKVIGCEGVVIDGRVRDLNEHRDMKFPVFAKSHSILPQNAFVRPSEIQVPIQISTTIVHPGDIIVGDLDGVVCIPKESIEQVVSNCEKHVKIDKQCMKAIQEGDKVKETFKKYRGN
ncbi:RraA-like protein [Cokeromyces recurvatus]|uniref:RraA-like protein n=1 Tax=Cokeromyces recurvatus TaxID=90255 RepID=UPI0022207E2B|nr:RraA-like protein [Cokeromyces recurvatus]KAI7907265.1 RraA-like protein [Cokeromyces recurvatus]